jgi:hypothetical protein
MHNLPVEIYIEDQETNKLRNEMHFKKAKN